MTGAEQNGPVEGLVGRVVAWLRAGYPTGVPEGDYVPLYGILRRTLTPAELDQVVEKLASDAAQADTTGDGHPLGTTQLRNRVEQLLLGPALPEDLDRVSARLASAGWPLTTGDETPQADPTLRTGLVTRIVQWLREGYPSGLPEQDFVPLIALLRRRLTDEEVADVAHRLTLAGHLPASRVDVGTAIALVTSELPSDDDVERVRGYLAGHGWPADFAV